jgi:hypothetical protein
VKKQSLFCAALCLVVGLTVVPAYTQGQVVKGRVPFNFTVLEKTLPAGDYMMLGSPHQLKIKDAYGKIVAMVLANEVSGGSAGKNDQIIFHCYRDRCFLAEVWFSSQENGRALPRSRAETNVGKEERGQYFAVLGEKPNRH